MATGTTGHFELSRRSLADQVAEALINLILDEGLTEGDSLPSTAELSARFGVSRTVVREALAALAGQGLLTRGQGRDSIVATPGTTQLTSLLQFHVRRDAVEASHIIDTRMALEVLAAEGAATSRTPEDVERLESALAALAAATKEQRFHQADLDLHRAIAEASRNPLITLILDALVDFLRDVRIKATRSRRTRGVGLDSAVEEHRAIVEAIVAGDPVAAAAAMRAHLESTAAEFNGATPSRSSTRRST